MAHVVPGRHTVDNSTDIVVLLIGARINKWWLLPLAIPILSRMTRMLRELQADPSSGLLGAQSFGMGGMVQYWRSVDHLVAYAEDRQKEHKPAATRFFQKLFRGNVAGVWHEIYVARAGCYEGYYVNMPSYALSSVRPFVPAVGPLATTRGRLHGLRAAAGEAERALDPAA